MSLFHWLSRSPARSAPRPAPSPAGPDAWAALRGSPPPPPPQPVVEAAPPEPPPEPPPPAPAPPPPALLVPRRRAVASVGALRTVAGAPVAYAGPNRIESTPIASPSDLGARPGAHRLTLHQPMLSAPPAPLYEAAQLPEFIRAPHNHRLLAPAAEILALPGHELGAAGLLQQDGRVWVDPTIQPGYINGPVTADKLALPEFWLGSLLKPDAEIIETDVPVGVALHPNLIYGHFLLEMLPRLHLLAKLRWFGRPLPIAVPNDCSKWVRDFVSLYFADTETIFYHSKRQRVRAPHFILPSMMMEDYAFHAEMNTAVEDLVGRVVGPYAPAAELPRRIYLSRRQHHRSWRGIVNEAEVEATLTDLGFAVLHPQTLPLPVQLAHYAAAECVVCEFSSAAHNTLFSPRGTAVFCIGWLQNSQSRIAALRGQPLAYMAPSDLRFLDPTQPRAEPEFFFRVDCLDLARRLSAFQRFAAEHRERQLGVADAA